MEFLELMAILIVSIFLGSIFFYGFGRRGPWGNFWSFLLIVFLGILLFDVWTEPVGPVWYGVGWLDLFFVGLIFALLLAASTPVSPTRSYKTESNKENVEASAVAIGIFFWLLLILFLVSISIGIWL